MEGNRLRLLRQLRTLLRKPLPSYEEDRVTIMELIELCGFIIEYETDGNGYILGVDEYGDSE